MLSYCYLMLNFVKDLIQFLIFQFSNHAPLLSSFDSVQTLELFLDLCHFIYLFSFPIKFDRDGSFHF